MSINLSSTVRLFKSNGNYKKEYDSGITLEEAASQLYVSEEYLSSQFKKETGYNFTETVRKYRIEK